MINMGERYYQEKFNVHLEDTSAYGNVYYLTYDRWAASTKESFLLNKVEEFSNLFKKEGIKLFVLNSSLRIFGEAKLHDGITVKLTCPLLKKLKAKLNYKYYNTECNKIAETESIIAFVDSQNRVIPIPENVQEALASISGRME